MGFDFESTEAMADSIFMGAGGVMPAIWTLIAAIVCIYALWSGNRHEHQAYDKLKK